MKVSYLGKDVELPEGASGFEAAKALDAAEKNKDIAIKSGDKAAAVAALKAAEPVLVRAAQKGVVHKRTASRKVSRLSQRVAKLGQ